MICIAILYALFNMLILCLSMSNNITIKKSGDTYTCDEGEIMLITLVIVAALPSVYLFFVEILIFIKHFHKNKYYDLDEEEQTELLLNCPNKDVTEAGLYGYDVETK